MFEFDIRNIFGLLFNWNVLRYKQGNYEEALKHLHIIEQILKEYKGKKNKDARFKIFFDWINISFDGIL